MHDGVQNGVDWERKLMSRQVLHDLVERIPEEELTTAQRFLEYLTSNPALRAVLTALPDDEPVTEDDAAAIRRAEADIRASRIVSHEDIVREFRR